MAGCTIDAAGELGLFVRAIRFLKVPGRACFAGITAGVVDKKHSERAWKRHRGANLAACWQTAGAKGAPGGRPAGDAKQGGRVFIV